MSNIFVKHKVKYELSFATEYKWLDDKSCYNYKTGRVVKQVYKNRCIGYNIRRKFYSLKYLRSYLIKPQKIKLPF